MRCPECDHHMRLRPPKCPSCGYILAPLEIKKIKRRRRLSFWIPAGLFLLMFFTIMLVGSLPAPYVKTIWLSDDEIEYLDTLTVSIVCENYGLMDTDYSFPVFIDEQEAAQLEFSLAGEEEKAQDLFFSIDDLGGPGAHTLRIENTKIPFTFLEPAVLSADYEPSDDYYAVGEPYQIAFSVTNSGVSAGLFDFTVLIDDTVQETDSLLVKAEKTKDHVSTVSYDTPGTHTLKINDAEYPITFYAVGSLENGQQLIKNTVRGYSYFDITNNTGQDIVFYITQKDSPEKAIAAHYIRDGKHYKVKSFPHGDYYMFVQTGLLWLPDVYRFGKKEKIYQSADISFHNSSDGNYQHYQYLDLELTPATLTQYFDRVGELPALTK